jgi:hypothetical protein
MPVGQSALVIDQRDALAAAGAATLAWATVVAGSVARPVGAPSPRTPAFLTAALDRTGS